MIKHLNRLLLVGLLAFGAVSAAHATGPDLTAPVTTIEGLTTSVATDWAAIAAVSAGALVFAITMRFIRKATR